MKRVARREEPQTATHKVRKRSERRTLANPLSHIPETNTAEFNTGGLSPVQQVNKRFKTNKQEDVDFARVHESMVIESPTETLPSSQYAECYAGTPTNMTKTPPSSPYAEPNAGTPTETPPSNIYAAPYAGTPTKTPPPSPYAAPNAGTPRRETVETEGKEIIEPLDQRQVTVKTDGSIAEDFFKLYMASHRSGGGPVENIEEGQQRNTFLVTFQKSQGKIPQSEKSSLLQVRTP